MKKVSFEENKTFNKSNVEKFINFHKKKLWLFNLGQFDICPEYQIL
jgi:hypothetical protein